ncbi:hypothetical protein [Aeromonas veronii]
MQSFGALILTEENGYITHVSVNTDAIVTVHRDGVDSTNSSGNG